MSTAVDSAQQFLSFSLPPTIQAMLPTQRLTEILNLPIQQIIPVPEMPAYVMGVCNWRGEVLWLVDLAALLGADPLHNQSLRQSNYSAVIIHHQGRTVGLVVGQVQQMLWCPTDKIQTLASNPLPPELAPCLSGYWLNPQGDTLWRLDAGAIAEYCQQQAQSNRV
jgi:positive phototaxis protein PixI